MEPARHIATAAPEPTEIIARARAMIPALAQRSLEGRHHRRIPDETVADMQRAGFFRVLQPKRWGGYEMDLHTFYEIQLALAEGDMSTAWIYGVSGVHPWFMALLGAMVATDSGRPPEGRIFLLPRKDYGTIDTWQVSGLQATGSWDVTVEDVFVPAYRSQSMLDN